MGRYGRYLLAILTGNILYFLLLPYLPRELQHKTQHIDLGLALDFILCVAIYFLIDKAWKSSNLRNSRV